MDFGDTEQEAAFRRRAREWLAAHAPAKDSEEDFSNEEDPRFTRQEFVDRCTAWQRQLHDGGWAGVTWPREHGGLGLGVSEHLIFTEEQEHYGVSTAPLTIALGLAGPTIIAHGRPDQQAAHLQSILRGEQVWCQLFSEPGAGSDLASMTTRAVRDGDAWVVNGQKVWTTFAHLSHFGLLVARTDPEAPKHRGLTYFLVDMSTPGVEVRPLRQMTGDHHFNEVFLDNVRIPDENVVGKVGDGWAVTLTTLNAERRMLGPGTFKMGEIPVDELCKLAQQHGSADHPIVRRRIIDAVMRDRVLRFLHWRNLTALQNGTMPDAASSIMKLLFARHLQLSGSLALDVQGANATLAGNDSEASGSILQRFLFAPAIRIAGGTDEVQRNLIAERLLGLPRDPSSSTSGSGVANSREVRT